MERLKRTTLRKESAHANQPLQPTPTAHTPAGHTLAEGDASSTHSAHSMKSVPSLSGQLGALGGANAEDDSSSASGASGAGVNEEGADSAARDGQEAEADPNEPLWFRELGTQLHAHAEVVDADADAQASTQPLSPPSASATGEMAIDGDGGSVGAHNQREREGEGPQLVLNALDTAETTSIRDFPDADFESTLTETVRSDGNLELKHRETNECMSHFFFSFFLLVILLFLNGLRYFLDFYFANNLVHSNQWRFPFSKKSFSDSDSPDARNSFPAPRRANNS